MDHSLITYKNGFTLIELLLSLSILSITIIQIIPLITLSRTLPRAQNNISLLVDAELEVWTLEKILLTHGVSYIDETTVKLQRINTENNCDKLLFKPKIMWVCNNQPLIPRQMQSVTPPAVSITLIKKEIMYVQITYDQKIILLPQT